MSAEPKNGRTLVKRRKWKLSSYMALFVAVLPLIGFVIFNGIPLIISFIGMFFDVDLYKVDLANLEEFKLEWNDFAGFKGVFIEGYARDHFFFDVNKYFSKAIWITLWIASTQLVTLGIALVMATLLREKKPGSGLFQILYFIPYICSTVAVSLMFRWLFEQQGGIINSIFGSDIRWLDNEKAPWTETICIIVAIIWQAPGYGIVMYKAAFSNINDDLYDAAAIDGANAWDKFVHVTIPGISPTTFYLLQAGVGAGLLTYDMARLIILNAWGEPGGRDSMGLTLMRLVRDLINENYKVPGDDMKFHLLSCACVISWLLFIVTSGISMYLFHQREKSLK